MTTFPLVTLVGRLAATVALSIFGVSVANAGPLPDSNEMRESVVRIEAEQDQGTSQGTGFIVNNHRTIATNNHVIDGAKSVLVTFLAGGKPMAVPARLVMTDPARDIAILETASDIFGEPVVLADYDSEPPEKVTAVGYPAAANLVAGDVTPSLVALQPSYSVGTVSRLLPKSDAMGGDRLIQHTATINPGNSGGPLFDECGRVIGINTLRTVPNQDSDFAQGIFYSVDIRELLPMLEANLLDARIAKKPCAPGVEARNDLAPADTPEAEAVVFDRFAACINARPCDADVCQSRYERRVSTTLAAGRKADVALRVAAAGPLCTQQKEADAYSDFQGCADNQPCDFDAQCAPKLQQSLRPEIMKKRQVLFDLVRNKAKAECEEASAPGIWRAAQTDQNVWTARVFNDGGAALIVNCVVGGDNSGDGIFEIDGVKGKRERWTGTRSTLMTIDEFSEPLRLDLKVSGNDLVAGVIHKETANDRGWLKELLGKLTVGGAVTIEEPKVSLDETFSLDGAKDALAPCLSAKFADQQAQSQDTKTSKQ